MYYWYWEGYYDYMYGCPFSPPMSAGNYYAYLDGWDDAADDYI